jgi:protein SCO1/2
VTEHGESEPAPVVRSPLRRLRLILWGAVAACCIVLGAGAIGLLFDRQPPAGIAAGAPLGGPFRLVDQTGAEVTEAIFRGKPSAVFFGFTHCPDVCPTTLAEMAAWAEALGTDADRLSFTFVTVDPERDTPLVLADYLGAFSDRIRGVTGEPQAVAAMLRDYKVFFRKAPQEGEAYSMDHTASVFLLDRNGALVGTISPGEPQEAALDKLRRLVEAS